MDSHPCFSTLERALIAYRSGRTREALALAEAAFRLSKDLPGASTQAGAVSSWYGYLLGTVGGNLDDGLLLCRDAAEHVFWEPRVFENLARLEIEAGSRTAALAAIRRGLNLNPEDRELKVIRRWLGVRRPPAVRFLGRNHPLNRFLGQLTHRPPRIVASAPARA